MIYLGVGIGIVFMLVVYFAYHCGEVEGYEHGHVDGRESAESRCKDRMIDKLEGIVKGAKP
jgi:hypothetical protein